MNNPTPARSVAEYAAVLVAAALLGILVAVYFQQRAAVNDANDRLTEDVKNSLLEEWNAED